MASNNGINGDTNNSKFKDNSDKYTNNFDPNEISPLRTGQAKESLGADSPQVQINMIQTAGTDDADAFVPKKKGANVIKGTYEAVLTHLDISQRARTSFLIATALCALLFVVIIVMIAFWPRIPFYMKADVCVERECMESSSQILLWVNTSVNMCDNPYEWACGKFEDAYRRHLKLDAFGFTGGEWNMKTHDDYEEISKVHAFIAQMPLAGSTFSAQSMLKGLYSTCMASETLDKQQADSELKKAIHILLGWVHDENWVSNNWDFRQAMTIIQSKYGIFPFFKLTVVNRNSKPFGNIIKISEGEYGLPHKMFYNLDAEHEVIRAYKLFLRDFAINYGVVSDNANKFADEVFHFEKRIVNSLPERRQPVILTLSEVQKLANSLPISEAITTTFSKLNDQTLILVEDEAMLAQLSTIVSTSDESPLNNFVTWSLMRHYAPFMSHAYRAALQEFNRHIYGLARTQPIWYFCTKLIKNWMPFAVDGLRQNPRLIVTASANTGKNRNSDHYSVQDRTNYNHELVKMIFYHLRHQLKRSIDENVSIDQEITTFINDKLSKMKLQIGTPSELLQTDEYLNKFYKEFYWRKLHFLDNLEHHWAFVKRKMENMLEPMNVTDKIIANLYSPSGSNYNQLVQYSIDLNMIIVSNRAVEKPFFHYKYPISVNFARIGTELSKALLSAVFRIGEQYKEEFYANHKLINKTRTPFSLGETDCIERQGDPKIPQTTKDSLISDISSGRFTSNCLAEFLRLMEASEPIPDPELHDTVTYDLFDLRQRKRQPGLRSLDDMQLFSLVYLQRYCSATDGNYNVYKAFVEMEIAARQGFNINWDQLSWLKKSLSCAPTKKQCKKIV